MESPRFAPFLSIGFLNGYPKTFTEIFNSPLVTSPPTRSTLNSSKVSLIPLENFSYQEISSMSLVRAIEIKDGKEPIPAKSLRAVVIDL